jgi:hypothetical protein
MSLEAALRLRESDLEEYTRLPSLSASQPPHRNFISETHQSFIELK